MTTTTRLGAARRGAFGMTPTTLATIEDWADVMRRFWRGEIILNHDGPLGKYSVLVLDPDFDDDIRLALLALGPKTLELGW